ncbi:F-box domain containing protein [Pandoravirus quercus]|uniref:F-box domain containing protein n=1 Tax=Pandoravirus quercus TaxID=2107709 RepID=A0A2U7U9D4_9VIRU|nr:F-box domain containing protein [Pandoravirus quercus]AVK75058.1 F-box domain containing protein [Pandoravirus quercus]
MTDNIWETTSTEALLPDELWLAVFEYLGPRDLAGVQATCTRWSLLACDGALWRPLLAAVMTCTLDLCALVTDDLTGLAIKDAYACRVLQSADRACPPATTASASRGITARRDRKSGALLHGHFDRRGRLQGYGEVDLLHRDNKGRTSVAIYRGMFRDGARHGRGALTVECGACNGQRHSWDCPVYAYMNAACRGVLDVLTALAPDKHTRVLFRGEFVDGLADGFGCATYTEGDDLRIEYKGEWKRGRWHGRGRADSKDGAYCEGNFVRGRPDGDVRVRCVAPIPYLFEGHAARKDALVGQFTFDDGTRLIVNRLHSSVGLFGVTMHAPDGTVYTNGTWDLNGYGHATDPRPGGRCYARFHQFTKPCDMAVTDYHGRVWHGCTGGCFGETHHRPRGVQEITYPNGDVLVVQWDNAVGLLSDRLGSILSFSVSVDCPDARFAGTTFRGCEWWHDRVGEPRGGRSGEWIFEPRNQRTAQWERFLPMCARVSGRGLPPLSRPIGDRLNHMVF